MNTSKLKSNIHEIVDRIESEQLLETIHDFLTAHENAESGAIWDSLSATQKDEVLLSYEESESEENLVDFKEAMKRD